MGVDVFFYLEVFLWVNILYHFGEYLVTETPDVADMVATTGDAAAAAAAAAAATFEHKVAFEIPDCFLPIDLPF